MAMTIEALPTHYDGYLFRSRLEARWTVFFNALRIPYEYEAEGFQLGELGCYLPDFRLPAHRYWIEIKGQQPTRDEIRKLGAVSIATGWKSYIFSGAMPFADPDTHYGEFPETAIRVPDCESDLDDTDGGDDCQIWCECRTCGLFEIHYEGRAHRVSCHTVEAHGRGHNAGTPSLVAAYGAARRARFDARP